MNTKKLFTEDAYRKDCDATVVDIKTDEEGRQIVVLDQTVFYAMSGGQPGDVGIISGPNGSEKVIDTRYATHEKLMIYHYLEGPTSLQKGDKVTCEIDWDNRYMNMRLHSLVHIVGMLFEKKHGQQKCIGSNISSKGRIDYEYFGEMNLDALQKEAQALIDQAHEIYTRGEEGNEVRRIWNMDPLGDMPCGGTHPKNSSEIGRIKLKRKGLGKQGQRLYCMLADA